MPKSVVLFTSLLLCAPAHTRAEFAAPEPVQRASHVLEAARGHAPHHRHGHRHRHERGHGHGYWHGHRHWHGHEHWHGRAPRYYDWRRFGYPYRPYPHHRHHRHHRYLEQWQGHRGGGRHRGDANV